MSGIDSNTVLMLHMNGTDGSTTFTDSSSSARAVTVVGNSQIDTAQSKFGGACGLFDGAGDRLSVADSPSFAFINATIDFWVRFNVVGTTMFYMQDDGSNAIYLQYYHPNTTFNFQIYYGGGQKVSLTPTWTPVANTWYHLALVKDGTTYRAFVDGTQIGSVVDADIWPNAAAPVLIGSNASGTSCLNGWLDEYRVSNVARWSANFTPPTESYAEVPPPEPVDLGDVKNQYFADKAALLDPDCQVYLRNSFSVTVPEGETWYIFNAWKCFVNGNGHEFYHRRIGVEDAMPITEGTTITGVSTSLLWYARPVLVQEDERYEEAELLYYTRLAVLKTLPTKVLHVGRAANSTAGGYASFPTTFTRAMVVQNFTHGGAFTVMDGGSGSLYAKERITNLDIELNDGHEIRTTLNSLQPFRRDMFDGLWLGLGNRSDTYGLPHHELTSGGVAYQELPTDF